MHSVEPQQTVTSRSGSNAMPVKRSCFATSASRRRLAPHVMAYWFTSAITARAASCLMISGAGKSGKPWDRLTAPCRWASRVISRITLSVKRRLFCETRMEPPNDAWVGDGWGV